MTKYDVRLSKSHLNYNNQLNDFPNHLPPGINLTKYNSETLATGNTNDCVRFRAFVLTAGNTNDYLCVCERVRFDSDKYK